MIGDCPLVWLIFDAVRRKSPWRAKHPARFVTHRVANRPHLPKGEADE